MSDEYVRRRYGYGGSVHRKAREGSDLRPACGVGTHPKQEWVPVSPIDGISATYLCRRPNCFPEKGNT